MYQHVRLFVCLFRFNNFRKINKYSNQNRKYAIINTKYSHLTVMHEEIRLLDLEEEVTKILRNVANH